MRLLVLAVIGVALGVVVRVVLGRRSSGDGPVAPLRVASSSDDPRPFASRPSPSEAVRADDAGAEHGHSARPAPLTVVEEPRPRTSGLDASAGWEELTATTMGRRLDR